MSVTGEVTVLVVDDHPMVREGLCALLGSAPGIRVLGDVGTGEEAVELVGELRPDLVLMDIRLPGVSGIEATRRIKQLHTRTNVILLTMHDNEVYLAEGMQAGATGYLLKDCSREQLCQAVEAVMEGSIVITPKVLDNILQALENGRPQEDEVSRELHQERHPEAGELEPDAGGRGRPNVGPGEVR